MNPNRILPLAIGGSLLTGLVRTVCSPVAHDQYGAARVSMMPARNLSALELRAQDEAAIQLALLDTPMNNGNLLQVVVEASANPLQVWGKSYSSEYLLDTLLRLETRDPKATYIGVDTKEDVIDPSPELMRKLLATQPLLKPASALAKLGREARYTLFTVNGLTWQSKNRVEVCGTYRSAGGAFSDLIFMATRGKASKSSPSGWVLKGGGVRSLDYVDSSARRHTNSCEISEPVKADLIAE